MNLIRRISALILAILLAVSNTPHQSIRKLGNPLEASVRLFDREALQSPQIAFRDHILPAASHYCSRLYQIYRETLDEKSLTVRQVYVALGLTYAATALSITGTLLVPQLFGQSPLAKVSFDAYLIGINTGLLIYMGLPFLAFLFSQRIIRETLGLARRAIQLNYKNVANHSIDFDRWLVGDPKPGSYLGSWKKDLVAWFFFSHIDFSSYPARYGTPKEKISWLLDALLSDLYRVENQSMTPINNPYVLRAGARANHIAYRILRTALLLASAIYLGWLRASSPLTPVALVCFVLLNSALTSLTVSNFWLSQRETPTRDTPLYEIPQSEVRWSFPRNLPPGETAQRIDRSQSFMAILNRLQRMGIVPGRSIQIDLHGNIEIPIKAQPTRINPLTPPDMGPLLDERIETIPDHLHRREILVELSDPSILHEILDWLKQMQPGKKRHRKTLFEARFPVYAELSDLLESEYGIQLGNKQRSRMYIESLDSLTLNGKHHYRIVCVGPDSDPDPEITTEIKSTMLPALAAYCERYGTTINVSVRDFERLKVEGQRKPKKRNEKRRATIEINDANDLPGNLERITSQLADENLNIESLRQETSASGVVMKFEISTRDSKLNLQSTVNRLKSLEFPPQAHRSKDVAHQLRINFYIPDEPGNFNAVARVLATHQLNLKEVLLENAHAIRPGHHWAYIEADNPGLDIDELRQKLLTLGFIDPDELSIRVERISRSSALAAERMLKSVTPRNPSHDFIPPDFNEDLRDPDHRIFLKNFRWAIWIAGLAHGNPFMHKHLKRWGGWIPLWLFAPLRLLFPSFYHAWIGPTWFEAVPQGRKKDPLENHLEHTARVTRILLSVGDRDPLGLTVGVLHDSLEDAFKNIWKQYDALLGAAAEGRLSWFRRRDSIARMQAVTQFIISELEFHERSPEAEQLRELHLDWSHLLDKNLLHRRRVDPKSFKEKLEMATQRLVETQILSSMRRYGSAVWMGVTEMSNMSDQDKSKHAKYRLYVQELIWRRELYKLRLKFADQVDNLRQPVNRASHANTISKNVAHIVPAALDVISPSYVHKRRGVDERMVLLYFQTLFEQSLSIHYLPAVDVYEDQSALENPDAWRANAIEHTRTLLTLLQDDTHPMRRGCLRDPLLHFERLLKEQLTDLESGLSWEDMVKKSKRLNAEESEQTGGSSGRHLQTAG